MSHRVLEYLVIPPDKPFYEINEKLIHDWEMNLTDELTKRLRPDVDGFVLKETIRQTYKDVLAENMTNISFPSTDQHMKHLEERYTFINSTIHITQLTDWIQCIAPFVERLHNSSNKVISDTTICAHDNPCSAEGPPDAEIAIAILKALKMSFSSLTFSSYVDEISVIQPATMTTPLGISIVENLHLVSRSIKYEGCKMSNCLNDVTSGLSPLIMDIVKMGIPSPSPKRRYANEEREELELSLHDKLQRLIEDLAILGIENAEIKFEPPRFVRKKFNIKLIREPLDSRQPADLDVIRALLGEQLETLSKVNIDLPALPKMDFTGEFVIPYIVC